MATYTPPPYFPQSSLAPPSKNRYLKFKLMVFAVIISPESDGEFGIC